MEPNQKKNHRPRKGGIFPYLAVFLLVCTLWGLLLDLTPGKTLSRALEKTWNDLEKREEAVFFLREILQDGSFSMENGGETVSHQAGLPERAQLSLSGEGYDLSLFSEGERLILKSDALLDESLAGVRKGAAENLENSAFVSDGIPEEETLFFFRLYLALTDPSFANAGDTLSQMGKTVWKALCPKGTREKTTLEKEGQSVRITKISYSFGKEQLSKGLNAFLKACQKEETRQNLCACLSAIRALSGNRLSGEEKEAFLSFLSGQGEAFSAFSSALSEEGSQAVLSFSLRSGRVIGIQLSFTFGSVSGEGALFLGENVRKSRESNLNFSIRNGEETRFSLALSHRISEDSKKAYIREWEYAFSDSDAFFLEAEESEVQGKIRFSWGREKGDLGLRLITPEKEINFRGALGEYKKGKSLSLTISRLEVNRENKLTGGSVTLSASREKAIPAAAPEASAPLFPDGEEKEALRRSFSEKYRELFPENSL